MSFLSTLDSDSALPSFFEVVMIDRMNEALKVLQQTSRERFQRRQ